jgi:hypothetical protein
MFWELVKNAFENRGERQTDKGGGFPFFREHYTADDDVRRIICVAWLPLNFRTG